MSQNQINKNQKKLFKNFLEDSTPTQNQKYFISHQNKMIKQLQRQSDLSTSKNQEVSKNRINKSIRRDKQTQDNSLHFNQNLIDLNCKYRNNNAQNYRNKASTYLQQNERFNKQQKRSKQTSFNTIKSSQQKPYQTLSDNLNMLPIRQTRLTSSILRPPSIMKSQSLSSSNPMIPQINFQQNSILNKSCQDIKLTFANNLHKLVFKYTGGHASAIYNYHLKIKNETECKVTLKIKCTNPNHYQVRPLTTILDYQQIVSYSIELKLNSNDLSTTTLKHDLTRYMNDKFKILYTQQDQNQHHHMYNEGEKILPVCIEQTVEDRLAFANNSSLYTLDNLLLNKQNQQLNKQNSQLNKQNSKLNKQNSRLKQSKQSKFKNSISQLDKRTLQEKQILIYKKLIQQNNKKLNQIQTKVKVFQKKSVQNFNFLFSKQVFLLIGTLGLGIGWYFTG